MKEVFENSSGWVRGRSMWPNLIPGDILKTRLVPVNELKTGMIAVFPNEKEIGKIVHRIVSIRNCNGFFLVRTAGDKSGVDMRPYELTGECKLKTVTGVLRRGKYRRCTAFILPESVASDFFVRLLCRIVRRVLW